MTNIEDNTGEEERGDEFVAGIKRFRHALGTVHAQFDVLIAERDALRSQNETLLRDFTHLQTLYQDTMRDLENATRWRLAYRAMTIRLQQIQNELPSNYAANDGAIDDDKMKTVMNIINNRTQS